MDLEYILGKMVEFIKVCIIMIRNMAMGSIVGLMGGYSKVNGQMGNDKVKAKLSIKKGKQDKGYGKMIKDFIGQGKIQFLIHKLTKKLRSKSTTKKLLLKLKNVLQERFSNDLDYFILLP